MNGTATVRIYVNNEPCDVPAGAMLASVLLNLGVRRFHTSVTGESRAPLCAMGVCHECTVSVDGRAHTRACMTPVRDGQRVVTE